MNILVTGHTGFVGQNLVQMLRAEGHNVSGVDIDSINLEDPDEVYLSITGMDAVVHLAAETGVQASVEDPIACLGTNVVGTVNVLNAARHEGARVVVASTAAADKPQSPYGASKAACEAYVQAFHASYRMNASVVRFSNVYGPHSMHKTSIIGTLIQRALRNMPITIYGDGSQTRDFVHVRDACRAVCAMLTRDVAGHRFEVGSGMNVKIRRAISLVERCHGADLNIIREPARAGEVAHPTTDIAKAKALLDWEPVEGLADGIRETYVWMAGELAKGNG